MKITRFTYVAVLFLSLGFTSTGYAQFSGVINKTKEAINKKTEKKKEEPITQPANQPVNAEQPVSTSSNDNQAAPPRPAESALGTIYFSNQPFTNGTEGSKTSFSSNEFIYGRMVLKGGTVRTVLKPKQLDKEYPYYLLPFIPYTYYYFDGVRTKNESHWKYTLLTEAELDKTYWDFDMLPSPERAKTATILGDRIRDKTFPVSEFYQFLGKEKTKEGAHTFGVETFVEAVDFRGNPKPESEWQYLSSELTYTFKGADYPAIKANLEKLDDGFRARAVREQIANQPLPKEWTQPTNPILRGLTEPMLRTIYLNSFEAADRPKLKIIKFYADSARSEALWKVQNNDDGIPNYRYTNQWYTVFVRNTQANQCFFQGFGLRQFYSGGGTYGESAIDTNQEPTFFPCERIGGAAAPAKSVAAPATAPADNTGDAYQQGREQFKAKNYSEAIKSLSEVIKLNPNHEHGGAYFYRGTSYLHTDEYDVAIADLSKAVSLQNNPYDLAGFLLNRGIAYSCKKNEVLALADFNRVISLDPKSWKVYYQRGNVYYDTNKVSLALKDYNKAIELKPDFPKLYTYRADCHDKLGQKALANQDREMAQRLDK
jgi:Flp pilus assembly protein TadD